MNRRRGTRWSGAGSRHRAASFASRSAYAGSCHAGRCSPNLIACPPPDSHAAGSRMRGFVTISKVPEGPAAPLWCMARTLSPQRDCASPPTRITAGGGVPLCNASETILYVHNPCISFDSCDPQFRVSHHRAHHEGVAQASLWLWLGALGSGTWRALIRTAVTCWNGCGKHLGRWRLGRIRRGVAVGGDLGASCLP